MPTLPAIDPHSHAVYVRTLGHIDRYDNPGKGAGYTELDGTMGRMVHVWPDTDEDAPPVVSFAGTDNGLRGMVVSHPKQGQALSPALQAMRAQIGSAANPQSTITDRQGRFTAIFAFSVEKSGNYTYTLWIFDARTAHLIASTKLPLPWVAIAFDAAANRVLVTSADIAQLFTLTGLHALTTITHPMYLEAPQIAGYANRFYDSEPVAIDTSLGRAVVVSGPDYNGQGEVQIIDVVTGRVLRTLTLGDQPINVQTDTALHRAYILDLGTCTVNILDLRSEKLVATVAVDDSPHGLAVDQATGKVFVSYVNHGGFVAMFPAATTLKQQSGC
jgi:DNA-binding beta-propeller fold protein YncE